jgi:thioredoxin reductase (NADPH)
MKADKLVFEDREVTVDGIFMLKQAVAPSVLLYGLETADGHIIVDRACKTNLPGCFAAGDCTGRPYQYVKAAGEGNVAAHSAVEYLAQTN